MIDKRIDVILEYYKPNDDYNKIKQEIKSHPQCDYILDLLEEFMGYGGYLLDTITKTTLTNISNTLEKIESPLVVYLNY